MTEPESTAFSAQLALQGAEGRYEARIDERWSQGRAAYGGLVGALLARAIEREVASQRSLRSALIDFVAPAAAGSAQIQVTLLREGRALSHAEARLLQDGKLVALMVGAYGEGRASEVRLPGKPALGTPPPEQLPRLPYVEGLYPRFTQHFEYRISSTQPLFSGSSRAVLEGYVRHPHGGPVDAAGLLGLLDAWPPAILPMLKKPAPTSSVTWMVDFLGTPPQRGAESSQFYRYEAYGVGAGDGYGSCEARLWSPSGELVAASRQLVVEFS